MKILSPDIQSISLLLLLLLLLFSRSVVCDCLWPHGLHTPGFPVLHHLPEFAQTHVHLVSDTIQPSCPLLSHSPTAFNLSQHQDFFLWVSSSHQVAKKYWNFSFSISLSNEYSGLIPFRIDWFVLLAVQGTLKSLLHCHSSKASILQCSAFFMVQVSHLYMTTGKTIALTIQTHEAHLSMEFSSQEYWSGLHFLL